jgi:hypothetical protein
MKQAMTKTKSRQIASLGNQILNHPLLPEIFDRIERKLFDKWMVSDPAKREIIGNIVDSKNLFLKELRIIVEEAEEIENN